MITLQIKLTKTSLLLLVIFCLIPSIISAKAGFNSKVISGQVISISNENIIELNDGTLYYPFKEGDLLKITVQSIITIKYFLNLSDERIYLQVSPGEGSIENTSLPENYKTKKKKL